MLFGMGSLSLGELAGERMKVALEASSTEDEHDCFSAIRITRTFIMNKGFITYLTALIHELMVVK